MTRQETPGVCTWCGAESSDLSRYRVRGSDGQLKIGEWALSPCCVRDILGDSADEGWTVEPVAEPSTDAPREPR